MYKYEFLPDRDVNGDPTVRLLKNSEGIDKTASYSSLPDETQEYIKSLSPKEGYAYLLISALGDQNWDSNRNADFWPTKGLKNDTMEYGYKTYEKYGMWFHNHKNDDPSKSYGKVIKSVWNDLMGRIELIVEADLSKDDELRLALENCEVIKTSMGARVKYDICRVCHPEYEKFYDIPEEDMIKLANAKSLSEVYEIGKKHGIDLSYVKQLNSNKSSTIDFVNGSKKSEESGLGAYGIATDPSLYCDHMKNNRNQILPTGQRVCVVNLRPIFFDISKVRVNADKSSFVLSKVASEVGEDTISTDEQFKKAFCKLCDDKKAEIEKVVEGDVLTDDLDEIKEYYNEVVDPELYKKEKEFPDGFIDSLAKDHSVDDIIGSMSSIGMFPHPREFQRMVLISGKAKELSDESDNDNAFLDYKDIANIIPHVLKEMNEGKSEDYISKNNVNIIIINKLKNHMDERSDFPSHKVKRIMIMHKSAENKYTERDRSIEKKASIDYDKMFNTLAYMYTKLAFECMFKKEELVKQASILGGLAKGVVPGALIYGMVGKSHHDELNKGKTPGLGMRTLRRVAMPLSIAAGAMSLGLNKENLSKVPSLIGNGISSIGNKAFDFFKKNASETSSIIQNMAYHNVIIKTSSYGQTLEYLTNFNNDVVNTMLIGICIYEKNINNNG